VHGVESFKSDRRFEVWRWGVGHRGLLLRTIPAPEQRRVEVWIKPASAALMPSSLDGLSIEPATPEQAREWTAQGHGVTARADANLYIVRSGSFSGWILGGSLNTREDDGAEPSPWDDVLPS
jgi:hypothetical protein